MAIKFIIQATLIGMLIYQSYYALHDRVTRFYFEYRLLETIKYLIRYHKDFFIPFAGAMPFINARPDLDKIIHLQAPLLIWVMTAQGSAWFAGWILLNTRLGCLLTFISCPVFGIMFNLVEILDKMGLERSPKI